MEEEGIFQCPNCKRERFNAYTKWRKKIINNKEKWIFFAFSQNRALWKNSPIHNKWIHQYYNYSKEVFEFLSYTSPEECWKKTGGRSEEEITDLECSNCEYISSSVKEYMPK